MSDFYKQREETILSLQKKISDRIRCLSFNYSRTNNYGNCVSNGFLPKEYGKISKFVKKIEGFRLKFEKEDGYMAVQFFEDVMEYKRKLEARLK